MNSLPLLPTILVDIVGSAANIVFAFLALSYAFKLSRKDPDNFLWGYLYYVTLAIAAFSISRAAGHLVKEFLHITGHNQTWKMIAPFSGGVNTLCIISVSAVMIFYHKGVQAYEAIEHKAQKLKYSKARLASAARELKELNQNLEQKVEDRTAELSESEKKFRHLFTASKDMVFFTDNNNLILDINPSGLEMLGYGPDSKVKLTLDQVFHTQGFVQTYKKTLIWNGYIKDMEAEFVKQDGSVIYVLLSATALYDEHSNMIGSEAIAKDLTKVKTMMEQLVSSEKMASVGQMAAGVAHEINTPLGVILGYAQLMMYDFEPGSEEYENLEVIERQTQASKKIVADLLKYSRQSESTMENIDVNEVVSDVLAVTEHNLGLSHITVCVDLARELPQVTGDMEKLRQVILNLINNAHHAMEEEGTGHLYLTTRYDGQKERVVVEVRDTGHGIPPEVQPKIFDPFFTTKPVGKGTGLGLSVSYGIIQDHGGTIDVESPVRDGKEKDSPGTLFRLNLPPAPKA